jgi:hypothetical protein
MPSVVVDANCINAFQFERIHELIGTAFNAITHILTVHHIGLDDKMLCQQEWIDCAKGPDRLSLHDWISDQLASGKIVYYPSHADAAVSKKLSELGLPKKDVKWFLLAKACTALALISEDIDMYHPPAKAWTHKKKEKCKENYSGCICKFAKKNLDVQVMRLSHVTDLLKQDL